MQVEPAPAISEYEKEQRAVKANFERLKAERLARETGDRPWQSLAHVFFELNIRILDNDLAAIAVLAKGDAMLMLRCGSDERPNWFLAKAAPASWPKEIPRSRCWWRSRAGN
jgi:hypothetical protein